MITERSRSILAAGCLLLFWVCSKPRELPESFQLTLHPMEGGQIKLADFVERPLLLIFWTRDCESCGQISREAMVALQEEKLGAVILVSVNTERDAEQARNISTAQGLVGTSSILDPELKLVQALEIEGHPALLLIRPFADTVQLQKEYDLRPEAIDRIREMLKSSHP